MKKNTRNILRISTALVVLCLGSLLFFNRMNDACGQTVTSRGTVNNTATPSTSNIRNDTQKLSSTPPETEVTAPIPTMTGLPMTTPSSAPTPTETPTPTNTPVPLECTQIKIGDELQTVYEAKGEFEKNNHTLMFKMTAGRVYHNGFFLKDHRVYYAKMSGEIVRGWFKHCGNIYFFSRKNGQLTRKHLVEGVRLGRYGIAKNGEQNQTRAETYLKAAKILRHISDISDKKSGKLYKCYKWVMQFGYVRHRTMKEMMEQTNWKNTWDIIFANDIFDKHSGCCVSYSAAFALLAKECGYKRVTLCCDSGHAWDDIGGRLYDPLFAKARDFQANYNANYTDYRINPFITKKIS